AQRYAHAERERLFMRHDRMVGNALRRDAALGEFLAPARETVHEPALKRMALLNRMTVMAGKGLEEEMIEDALNYAALTDGSHAGPTRDERRTIAHAAQQRYFVLRVLENPLGFCTLALRLRRSSAGRSVLYAMARGLLGVARWGVRDRRERMTLLTVAARLFGAGLPGPGTRAQTDAHCT